MKRHLLLVLIAFSICGISTAELRISGSVFKMDELGEAKEKAAKDQEPLIFVYTDPGTSWGPCLATSSAAFKDFRSAGVVVFANSKGQGDWNLLPKGAKEVRSSAGNTIPMVLVTTADGSKGIQGISYNTLKKSTREAARELRKVLKEKPVEEILGGGGTDSLKEAEEKAGEETPDNKLFAESQAWTNSSGQTITAAIQKVEGDKVHFIMTNGSIVPYPIANLSEESRRKIKDLEG